MALFVNNFQSSTIQKLARGADRVELSDDPRDPGNGVIVTVWREAREQRYVLNFSGDPK